MRRLIKPTIILAIVLAGLFASEHPPSSGQEREGSNACGCFCDFKPPYPPVPPVSYVVFEKQNCTGIISADACREGLSNMPADKVKSICEKVKAQKGFKSFEATCPVFAAFCPEEKKSAGREKPTPPWFGPPPSDCKDVRKPEVDVVQTHQGTEVTVNLCGYTRFLTPPDPRAAKNFAAELASQIKSRIGSRICCEKFQEAVETGIPCHPRMDLDCDGFPEDSLLDIKLFHQSDNAQVDPFPPGLDPDDTKFFPPRDKCDCKWELVKGTLNCSADGKQLRYRGVSGKGFLNKPI